MLPFLSVLQFLILALWVGSMFGFAVLFSPVLFRLLPSREQAGSIAGESLTRIDSLGLVAGGIMLLITILQSIEAGWSRLNLGRMLVSAAMLAVVIFSSVSIRQRIAALRQQMGVPIDELAEDDPVRLEFRKQHRISRMLFGLNMLLGSLLIALSALA